MTSRTGDTLPVAEISILWLTAGLSCDGPPPPLVRSAAMLTFDVSARK